MTTRPDSHQYSGVNTSDSTVIAPLYSGERSPAIYCWRSLFWYRF
ncbi:hypothetical protein [Nostoc sp.]